MIKWKSNPVDFNDVVPFPYSRAYCLFGALDFLMVFSHFPNERKEGFLLGNFLSSGGLHPFSQNGTKAFVIKTGVYKLNAV